MNSILSLKHQVEKLEKNDPETYAIIKRIFRFNSEKGTLSIPDSFKSKVLDYFGYRDESGQLIEGEKEVLDRIGNQKIIQVHNIWSGESTLFNSLRAFRPGISGFELQKEKEYIKKLIKGSEKNCDFCNPLKYTPEDVFGRISGQHSVTASNIAKYDAWSSLVIFNEHNPLEFSLEELSDYLITGFDWFRAVHEQDDSFKFPFFIWNCLSKAGASQIHGHAQILVSKEPYAKIKSLRNVFQRYKKETGGDYFHDLYRAHDSLNLAGKNGKTCFFSSITPIKEKEMIIISPVSPRVSHNTRETIFKILRCFIDSLGVHSFNLSISCPPIEPKSSNIVEDIPFIIRIVDRGSILKSTADMGGMELYGSSVVADDPYKVIKSVKKCF